MAASQPSRSLSRNGAHSLNGLSGAPTHKAGFPAKAGTHSADAQTFAQWVPAFAGKPVWGSAASRDRPMSLLEVGDLSVTFAGWRAAPPVHAVKRVSFTLD